MLKVGDILFWNEKSGNRMTHGKPYEVKFIRHKYGPVQEEDICIMDDDGLTWWFGQIGSSDPWTRWFINETEFKRIINLEKLEI